MSLPSSCPSVSEESKFSSCDLWSGESVADQGALGGWEDRSPVCLEPAVRPRGETKEAPPGAPESHAHAQGKGKIT